MSIQVCVTGLVAYLSQKLGVTFYLLGILLCLMVTMKGCPNFRVAGVPK